MRIVINGQQAFGKACLEAVLKEGKKLKGQKLLVPMIDKTIKVTVSDTVFLDKENERING